MLRRILAAVCTALCALVLASCGARAVGYGVVLWGERTGAPQTAVGTYPVTATINDPAYRGSASGSFVINPVTLTGTAGATTAFSCCCLRRPLKRGRTTAIC